MCEKFFMYMSGNVTVRLFMLYSYYNLLFKISERNKDIQNMTM